MSAKIKAAVDIYIKMERNLAKSQGLILDLLVHPDATDEQRLEVAKSYRTLVASVDDARAKVLERCRREPMSYGYDVRIRTAFKERRKTCR